MTENRTAALVLAGGQARRMAAGEQPILPPADDPTISSAGGDQPAHISGIDKPLLTVGGRTMLASVIAALDVPHIAISANGDPDRFAAFGLPVLSDGLFQGQGPLAGVLAGLEWAAALGMTALLTAPGDMPFLPIGLAIWLAPPPRCVSSHGRRHHLVALWPVTCAAALRSLLSEPGPRHVANFAERIGMRYAEFAVPTGDPFANVNTRDDLTRARNRAGDGHGRRRELGKT
jgi:molybdopterin-guanine dinucleotide biosynthesis protein A